MAALSLELHEHRFPAAGGAPAKLALAGIRLDVAQGERVAIIGPSGCGKTTLLSIVAGLVTGFAGRLDLTPGATLGYVFQEPRLLPWRSLADNLRLVLPDSPDPGPRIAAALAEVELEGAAGVYASRLSLGMARRAALARAFVVQPDLLLLDEPFVSLDEPTAHRLRLLLLELIERHGATVLFVTHSLAEAIMVADRLLFLTASPGRVLETRLVPLSPAERRQPRSVDAFRQSLVDADARLAQLLVPPLEILS